MKQKVIPAVVYIHALLAVTPAARATSVSYTCHEFDHPFASHTQALGIDDSGQATGYHIGSKSTHDDHGFTTSADATPVHTAFDDLSGVGLTFGTGINNSGTASGYCLESGSACEAGYHGFARAPEAGSQLPVFVLNSGQWNQQQRQDYRPAAALRVRRALSFSAACRKLTSPGTGCTFSQKTVSIASQSLIRQYQPVRRIERKYSHPAILA
jgi:hypothetical protein